jgi:hypothetical protein
VADEIKDEPGFTPAEPQEETAPAPEAPAEEAAKEPVPEEAPAA